jgi:hypothetical protein
LQNNDLATDVARAIRANGLLTTAQREATEKGLAEALARLGIVAQASGDNRWCRQPDLEKNFYRCPEFWAALAALAAVGGFAAYEASRPSPVVSPN